MRQINTELAESLHQFIEGDKPVSTATVTINEGRLFLFLVATMPEARRKGYGEAVVRTCTADSPRNDGHQEDRAATPPKPYNRSICGSDTFRA